MSMIHRTTEERAVGILQDGLRTNMPLNLTDAGTWSHGWYGVNPVFLTMPDSPYLKALSADAVDGVDFMVDVDGLSLVADLPSLCDLGAQIDEDLMWWKEGKEPADLLEFLDEEGSIAIECLLDPDNEVCRAAILATRTAFCLSNIAADKLKIQDKNMMSSSPMR